MGKVNKLHNVVCLTSTMDVTYLKPVPLHKPLVVEGWEQRVRGREHYRSAEIRNPEGEVLATSKGKFIEIDPHRMFAKYLKKKHSDATLAKLQPLCFCAPSIWCRANAVDAADALAPSDDTEAGFLVQMNAGDVLGENPGLQRPDAIALRLCDQRVQQCRSRFPALARSQRRRRSPRPRRDRPAGSTQR